MAGIETENEVRGGSRGALQRNDEQEFDMKFMFGTLFKNQLLLLTY